MSKIQKKMSKKDKAIEEIAPEQLPEDKEIEVVTIKGVKGVKGGHR